MRSETIPVAPPNELPPPAPDIYDENSVGILRDAAHIRQRPGMYIGDTGPKGLHHLVYELVYNSVDEALAGFCKNIHVKINVDNSLSVTDDGRGIPVDMHPEAKRPTLEVVMTTVGAGAKFDKRTYKTSAGLHGMGAKAVTALSEWTEAEVRRNGKVYTQEYERGKPITEVKEIGAASGTGTKVTFKPDPQIFHAATFHYDTLEVRFRELAFLNKGLAITLTDERHNRTEVFKYDGGLAEFVTYLNRDEVVLHPPVYVDKTADDVRVEISMQYTVNEEERIRTYTNNAYTSSGGTHLSGFKAAITRALNAYGTKEDLFKNGLAPIGEDFREGLTAVISVQVPDPQFQGQTKDRLNNPEVEGIVTSIVHEQLTKFLEENPKESTKIMKKVILAAEARESAAKAKKALKHRKNILNSTGLPGKLLDCTSRDRDESELFLVEGQSAGGSAESGRDRKYQARSCPLRGKVLNVEKARVEKVLGNEELCNLISAVGVDIGSIDLAEVEKRRYGKIVILTDADVDGQHIRTLLLTFFYRQMRNLVEAGHIYVSRPPLYKVEQKKQTRFVQTMEEMVRELATRGLDGTKVTAHAAGSADPTAGDRVFEGESLAKLVKVLADLEDPILILERRSLTVAQLLARATPTGLPASAAWYCLARNAGSRPRPSKKPNRFREAEQSKRGHEFVVVDELHNATARAVNGNGRPAETFYLQELHEVVGINRGIEKLKEFGFVAGDLIPLPRIAGREPPLRYTLQNADSKAVLTHLRDLPPDIRRLGERGMKVTRFKGLGEMDPEELWDTTLDPTRRTLLRVKMEDAFKAERHVPHLDGREGLIVRRDFIQKHALEVKAKSTTSTCAYESRILAGIVAWRAA